MSGTSNGSLSSEGSIANSNLGNKHNFDQEGSNMNGTSSPNPGMALDTGGNNVSSGSSGRGGSSNGQTPNNVQTTNRRQNAIQAYLINLLGRIQPPPGMTRQQKLQQMIRNGELKREDILLLQRHQQYLRRQQQIRRAQQVARMQSSGKTVPGAGISNESLPDGTAHKVSGKSVPGKSLPVSAENQSHHRQMSPGMTDSATGTTQKNGFTTQQQLKQQIQQKYLLQQQQQQQKQNMHTQAQKSTTNQIHDNSQIQQNMRNIQMQQNQHQRTFFGLTQQQLAKLTPQQRKILIIQQLRKRARTEKFYESNEELLKKYENYPASIILHIHENYYQFGNSDAAIAKNSSVIKEFLKYVAFGIIPEALMEIIRDGGIKMYDGAIFLKVFDHRKLEESALKDDGHDELDAVLHGEKNNAGTPDTAAGKNNEHKNKAGKDVHDNETQEPEKTNIFKPKEYRTVLRMTQSSLYEDLSLQTDSQQFHDTFALTFESEVLTATNRNINLQPVLNPYKYDRSLWPDYDSVTPAYNEKADQVIFPHRKDAREVDGQGRDLEPITAQNLKYKPLHEDLSRSNSKYEQMITVLNEMYRHSNVALDKDNEVGNKPAQFDRLRFIESWKKRMALLKEQAVGGCNMKHPLGNSLSLRNTFPGSAAGGTGFGMFMTQKERMMMNQQQASEQQSKHQQEGSDTKDASSTKGSTKGVVVQIRKVRRKLEGRESLGRTQKSKERQDQKRGKRIKKRRRTPQRRLRAKSK